MDIYEGFELYDRDGKRVHVLKDGISVLDLSGKRVLACSLCLTNALKQDVKDFLVKDRVVKEMESLFQTFQETGMKLRDYVRYLDSKTVLTKQEEVFLEMFPDRWWKIDIKEES